MVFGRKFFKETLREGSDVVTTFAQRRNLENSHIQTVVQITAERARVHAFLQILVGGRYNADIDFARLRRADAHDFSVLQDTQEPGLHGQRKFADFVKEDRTAVSYFEIAGLAFGGGAGKGAPNIAEHVGFGQRLGNAATVHLEHELVTPRALVMNEARDHVLADAGLAENEHSGVCGRHSVHQGNDTLHGLTGEGRRL